MRGVLVVLVIAFAGCTTPTVQHHAGQAPLVEQPSVVPFDGYGCQSGTVFFLEEYSAANARLPAGFHVRDLSGFLHYSPAFAGVVPAFYANIECSQSAPDNASMSLGLMGFYVQSPYVESLQAADDGGADHDFYVVQAFGRGESQLDLFRDLGWAVQQDNGTVAVEAQEEARVRQETVRDPIVPPGPLPGNVVVYPPNDMHAATLAGQAGELEAPWFSYQGITGVPQSFAQPPLLRFWHATDDGLGFLEYQIPQQTIPVGTAACHIAPDSPLDVMLGRANSADASVMDDCPPDQSFALAFALHDLVGRFVHLPNERAG